ncbi:hypothetical protein SASPL_101324 [Salvia splendens]|uniref:Ubiquitin-like protease family profile domain-containing protein n=1 Tax=Salvia splendens TaxID=180675 RepID=A0A8X8YUC5_SALSN|nr:hypothetical protein SASPL_101324 [Salvia splendens]
MVRQREAIEEPEIEEECERQSAEARSHTENEGGSGNNSDKDKGIEIWLPFVMKLLLYDLTAHKVEGFLQLDMTLWLKNCYGRMLRKAIPEHLEFKWKTEGITNDCGVFAMRHMETYMGTKVNDWKCALTNKPSKSFQLLRAKFLTAMVYSNENKFVIT